MQIGRNSRLQPAEQGLQGRLRCIELQGRDMTRCPVGWQGEDRYMRGPLRRAQIRTQKESVDRLPAAFADTGL